jgi:hypothetical protein
MTFLHTHILPLCLRASPDSRLKGSHDRRKIKGKDQSWSRATNSSQRSLEELTTLPHVPKTDITHIHFHPTPPHAPSRLQQPTSLHLLARLLPPDVPKLRPWPLLLVLWLSIRLRFGTFGQAEEEEDGGEGCKAPVAPHSS